MPAAKRKFTDIHLPKTPLKLSQCTWSSKANSLTSSWRAHLSQPPRAQSNCANADGGIRLGTLLQEYLNLTLSMDLFRRKAMDYEWSIQRSTSKIPLQPGPRPKILFSWSLPPPAGPRPPKTTRCNRMPHHSRVSTLNYPIPSPSGSTCGLNLHPADDRIRPLTIP